MKKVGTLLITVAMLVTMCVPVMADPITDTTSHTEQVPVTATLESSYTVTLPASLALEHDNTAPENNTYVKDYKVKANGHVADDSYVSIVPQSSFELTDTTDSTNKVTASVTQESTKWARVGDTSNASDVVLALGVETDGKVSAVLTKNGSYSGNLVFTYQMQNNTP